jgi:hypothetical protein
VKKKQVKKIVLSKETLRRLEDGPAQEVNGGMTPLCSGSCYNSCPKTCDC